MRNHFRQRFRSSPGGFTLVEMLVAVAMGAALVAAAATVFSLAGEAIGTSKANTEVSSQLRVLFSWLQRDFARIRLDGPLVLYPQEDDLDDNGTVDADERIDQVCFLISGDIPSMRVSDRASLAIVLYGPDVSVENPPLEEPYEWIFTRRGTLIMSDSSVIAEDVEQSSFAQVMVDFFTSISSGVWSGIWVPAWAKPDLSDLETTDDLHTYLTGNVVSFEIVRYYMASTGTESSAARTFGPTDEKPAWIEFEVVLRDSNNRMPDGFTATYRVNLPSR